MDMSWEGFQFFVLTGAGTIMLFLLHYYLILPWDIKKDLSDVAFDHLTNGYYKSARNKKKHKRELVREAQRLRKIGDLPPIYPNGWFGLLESENLKKDEVKYVVALGENFAVFRNSLGEVKILDAYCPHLGANMAIGGVVRGNCLECPFHKWAFDGETGQCSSVPYSEKTPDFIKVKKWECVEVNDFIFVWYHAENEKPSWYPESLDVIKTQKLRYHGRSELLIGCHIQEIIENLADTAHFTTIHSLSLEFRTLYLNFNVTAPEEWNQSLDENHVSRIFTLGSLDGRIFNKFSIPIARNKVKQLGPGYTELMTTLLGLKMLLVFTITPVEALVQKFTVRIYAPYFSMLPAKFLLWSVMKGTGRDIIIWNHKKHLDKPMLIKEDQGISRFRRWFQQFYSESSPKFSYQKDSLAW